MADKPTQATLVEVQHASEMRGNLRQRMAESNLEDPGRMDSVRAGILGYVVGENYARGAEELRAYVDYKQDYAEFRRQARQYVEQSCDLIRAIESKRHRPGLASLSMSKQQELHEQVLAHFRELKNNLKMIEKLERDQKMIDVRSTVWVVKVASAALLAILFAGLVNDFRAGTLSSTITVSESLLDDVSTWVVARLPF